RGSHAQSWNPGLFDHSRYQSDGLMAHGSGGHQEERISFGPFEFIRNFWGELGAHFACGVDAAHEAEAWIVQFADHFLALQLFESFPRKHAVRIDLRILRWISEVPDIQIVAGRAGWNAPVGRILAMEARLITVHDAAGTNECYLALCDRLGEWRPGHGFVG